MRGIQELRTSVDCLLHAFDAPFRRANALQFNRERFKAPDRIANVVEFVLHIPAGFLWHHPGIGQSIEGPRVTRESFLPFLDRGGELRRYGDHIRVHIAEAALSVGDCLLLREDVYFLEMALDVAFLLPDRSEQRGDAIFAVDPCLAVQRFVPGYTGTLLWASSLTASAQNSAITKIFDLGIRFLSFRFIFCFSRTRPAPRR